MESFYRWKLKINKKRIERRFANVKNQRMDCSMFAGYTILVTGATGLIGRCIIYTLLEWNRENPDHLIGIAAVVRDKIKAERYFGTTEIQYIVGDIQTVDFGQIHADYIIHGASETSSKVFVDKPVKVIKTALEGTRHMLEYAVKNRIKGFVYLSSMEVYGTPETDEKITENYTASPDTMKVRSCYPESKRMCETMCVSYMAQYGLPVAVFRLAQTFGEEVEYTDQRVFAEFARCVIEKKDIVLKTKGETKRSYLYLQDAVEAIFLVISRAGYGEAYNVANEETYCSIVEMAQLVAEQVASGRIGVRVELEETEKLGYAPTLHMNLDTSKLRKLGWRPKVGLEQMYRSMVDGMEKSIL